MKHSNSILPASDEKPIFVNQMFARIAPTYDLMNRLMTFGLDQSWRRQLLQLAHLPLRGSLLDIGTGTGDIAQEAQIRYPGIRAYGADFTYEMMAVGKASAARAALPFMQADTFYLPFADNTFDAVVSGFLIRNVVDRAAAFREQARVTKPGGRVLCLETTPPSNAALGPLVSFYVFQILPILGGLISGDPAAYRYLPQSTVEFPAPTQLQSLMEQAGLVNVFYQERNFGTVAIHVGTKISKAVGQ